MLIKWIAYFFLTISSSVLLIQQDKQISPIKFGFLLQSEYSDDAKKGAELAVSVINGSGGIKGRPVKLIIKSMEGPWGTGSNRAGSLIFDEEVIAVIGSTDGRNAHLVEQACTKTQVLFISCLSADPTLAQAFVPWFFNIVPNDQQQSQILAEDIFMKNKYRKIAVISAYDYDFKTSSKYFSRIISSRTDNNRADIRIFDIERNAVNINETLINVVSFSPDCIVFFCQPDIALKFFNELKKRNRLIAAYGNIYLAAENKKKFDMISEEGFKINIPLTVRLDNRYNWFRDNYIRMYNTIPGLSAEFAFDAVMLLSKALTETRSDRESLQNYLFKNSFDGVTGIISFDERGNRKGPFRIIEF